MTSSNFVIRLSVLLAIRLIQLTTCQQNSKEVALLKQMQDWGKGVYRAIENKTNPHSEGQYLVAALVSDVQAVSPNTFYQSLLKGCPSTPDEQNKIMECNTSAVILNLKSQRIWNESKWRDNITYQDHAWHGEYRLLHDGIINSMLRNFRHENEDNASCQLLLYSFYIPCADIPGTPYSCSELIYDYNRNNNECKIYTTGFTKVFRRNNITKTNQTKAESLLKVCLELKQINTQTKLVALKEIRSATSEVFQTKMFDCVMNSPLSACCIIENDNTRRIQAVSYFINTLLNEAASLPIGVHGKQSLKVRKKIKKKTKQKETKQKETKQKFSMAKRNIEKNIKKILEQKIGTDCYECSRNSPVAVLYHRYLLHFCAQTALDLSDTFGLPVGSLLSGKWQSPEPKPDREVPTLYLNRMNRFPNKGLRDRICLGNLDPSSLCTDLM